LRHYQTANLSFPASRELLSAVTQETQPLAVIPARLPKSAMADGGQAFGKRESPPASGRHLIDARLKHSGMTGLLY